MTKRTRRNHAPAFRRKWRWPPPREDVGGWAQRFDVHPNQITQWKGVITISMDCKGSWRDNVFVERLWRGVKYEEVYPRAYASVGEARASITRHLTFYNE